MRVRVKKSWMIFANSMHGIWVPGLHGLGFRRHASLWSIFTEKKHEGCARVVRGRA